RPDAVTEQMRAEADVWRAISASSDAQLAEIVRGDRIDILVDLAAHSGRNRLLTFARRPAPVQVTYLGYCSTAGVDAIDFRLTDRFLDPPDMDLSVYTERSIYLPDCYWCYSAPSLPRARRSGATDRQAGTPTFGCLNNFAKVTRPTLELWSKVLQRVPEARLLLHAPAGSHRERVGETLRQAG